RLVAQASALLTANRARAAWCDLSALEFGPAEHVAVAGALAAAAPLGARAAVTGTPRTLRGARRIVRMAGMAEQLRVFESPAEAELWLSEVVGTRTTLPETARRHVEEFGGVRPDPDPMAATSRRTSAA